jgi:hypothetical protein
MNQLIQPIIKGHIKITDRTTGEVLVDKDNAVNYENISIAMANTLAGTLATTLSQPRQGTIYKMAFGNGGASVDPTGIITYLPPNVTGQNAALYNETYAKVVDQNSSTNLDPANNKMTVLHTAGNVYTDILVTCLLDYGEPAGQQAFDNSTNFNGEYVFDELGLQCWGGAESSNLSLITHVIFHPVQKSLNRQIQIDYTLRIQTLTNLSTA